MKEAFFKKRIRVFWAALATVLSFLYVLAAIQPAAVCAKESDTDQPVLTIVIDPGHGGNNQGALWNGWTEKNITMVTARAMKEHLEKFEGVKVLFTHENTEDSMSIEDRAKFAARVGADYLFCLHYNMSAKHTHYGAEIWIPRRGDNNRTGYQFAVIEMDELKAIGLSDRGIKTRKNKKNEDYYGILRYSEENGIPSVLIEHAHLDHQNDSFFTNELSDFARFGRIDAEAVAKFYGLKSEELGLDFSTEDYRVPVKSNRTYGIDSATLPGDYVITSTISPVEDPAKLVDKDSDIYEGIDEPEQAESEDGGGEEGDGGEHVNDWAGLTDLRTGESYASPGEESDAEEVPALSEAGEEDEDENEDIYREADDDEPHVDFFSLSRREKSMLLAVGALILAGIGACLVSAAKR